MEILTGVVLVVVAVGALVEVAKRAGVPARYLPALGLVLGLGLTIYQNGFGFTSLVEGIMIGLTPSGIWEFSKHSILGK